MNLVKCSHQSFFSERYFTEILLFATSFSPMRDPFPKHRQEGESLKLTPRLVSYAWFLLVLPQQRFKTHNETLWFHVSTAQAQCLHVASKIRPVLKLGFS